MTKKKGKNWL